MSHEDVLSEALAILGELTGGDPLAFDEDGLCSLTHQDGFVVTLMTAPGSDILLISAQLADVPETGKDALFAHLLRLNFLGLETGGASLGVDEEEHHIYLSHGVPIARVDAQGLVSIIGNFIDVAAGLRQRILGQRVFESSSGDGEQPSSPGQAPGWIIG